MTIAIVTETYWPEINGVAMTLTRLVQGLVNRGNNVQLICPAVKGRNISQIPRLVSYHCVKGIAIPGYKEAKLGWPSKNFLKELWLEKRPDVIYVATEGPLGWSAIKEANTQNIPIVSGFHTNFHTYSQHYKLGFLEKLVKRYLVLLHNKSKTTLVPTHEQKFKIEAMGIHDVSVMGRGVDTELFSPEKRNPALRMQWGVKTNDTVMIYVGRIAEEKNLELIINSYFLLRKQDPAIKFILVGDGPLKIKLAKKYPDFIFAGMKTSEMLAQYYASADIFVFSSITETFGNVILEAMASGLSVMTYDYAAGRLHITSGENGFLAKFNNPDEFLDKVKSLLKNRVLLKKIRINARKHALQNSWPSVVAQFENILYSFCTSYLVGHRLNKKNTVQNHYLERKIM